MFFSKWHYLLLNFKKKQMIAGDIISEIIKRMKFWGSRFPHATTSFIPNTRSNSFYLIQNRGDNNLPVQIRLSNHGTYLETWTDRKELGDSVDRKDLQTKSCDLCQQVFFFLTYFFDTVDSQCLNSLR